MRWFHCNGWYHIGATHTDSCCWVSTNVKQKVWSLLWHLMFQCLIIVGGCVINAICFHTSNFCSNSYTYPISSHPQCYSFLHLQHNLVCNKLGIVFAHVLSHMSDVGKKTSIYAIMENRAYPNPTFIKTLDFSNDCSIMNLKFELFRFGQDHYCLDYDTNCSLWLHSVLEQAWCKPHRSSLWICTFLSQR